MKALFRRCANLPRASKIAVSAASLLLVVLVAGGVLLATRPQLLAGMSAALPGDASHGTDVYPPGWSGTADGTSAVYKLMPNHLGTAQRFVTRNVWFAPRRRIH